MGIARALGKPIPTLAGFEAFPDEYKLPSDQAT
jgi:hypothetical protein